LGDGHRPQQTRESKEAGFQRLSGDFNKFRIDGSGIDLSARREMTGQLQTVSRNERPILLQHLQALCRMEITYLLLGQLSIDKVTIAVLGESKIQEMSVNGSP
jgi:hypothetical protein